MSQAHASEIVDMTLPRRTDARTGPLREITVKVYSCIFLSVCVDCFRRFDWLILVRQARRPPVSPPAVVWFDWRDCTASNGARTTFGWERMRCAIWQEIRTVYVFDFPDTIVDVF